MIKPFCKINTKNYIEGYAGEQKKSCSTSSSLIKIHASNIKNKIVPRELFLHFLSNKHFFYTLLLIDDDFKGKFSSTVLTIKKVLLL